MSKSITAVPSLCGVSIAFDYTHRTEGKYGWLSSDPAYVSWKHEDDKIICFERAGCLFVFNFHVNKSFADYRVGVDQPGYYQVQETKRI